MYPFVRELWSNAALIVLMAKLYVQVYLDHAFQLLEKHHPTKYGIMSHFVAVFWRVYSVKVRLAYRYIY
ncbi:hypothetical protein F5Y06DRAFT_258397, partial [Hypoxylon sp. FL0890]